VEAILRPIERLGRRTVAAVGSVGYAGMLLIESVYFTCWGWRRGQPVRWRMVFEQMRQVGVDAIPIVCLLSFAIGVMLAIQGIHTLKQFGAQTQVVLGIALSVTREFGPLMTGIVVAGRSGSSLAARIGTMNINQEVDALRRDRASSRCVTWWRRR
jgi:phospholipid/cholesterol/gamma-HCH transport system permease protein